MIVVISPNKTNGTIVYWHSKNALTRDSFPLIAASYRSVEVYGKTHQVTTEMIESAQAVHDILRRDMDADMSHVATHKPQPGASGYGPVEPIK